MKKKKGYSHSFFLRKIWKLIDVIVLYQTTGFGEVNSGFEALSHNLLVLCFFLVKNINMFELQYIKMTLA